MFSKLKARQQLKSSTQSNASFSSCLQSMLTCDSIRANAKVAAFIRTDVSKYKDNVALFKLAEKEFGGVDVSGLVTTYNDN